MKNYNKIIYVGLLILILSIISIVSYNFWYQSQIPKLETVKSNIIKGLNDDPIRTNNGKLIITTDSEFQNERRRVDFFNKTKPNGKYILIVVRESSYLQTAAFSQYEKDNTNNYISRKLDISMNTGTYQDAINIATNINSLEDINKGLKTGDKGYDNRFSTLSVITREYLVEQKQKEDQRTLDREKYCDKDNTLQKVIDAKFSEDFVLPYKIDVDTFSKCYVATIGGEPGSYIFYLQRQIEAGKFVK